MTHRRASYAATLVLLVAVAAVCAGTAPPTTAPAAPKVAKIGEAVPDFTLSDANGQVRKLSECEGRIVVLEWINPECPYVARHYRSGSMPDTYRKVKEIDPTIVWLAIDSTSTTTAAKCKFWIDTYDLKYPILLDPDGAVGHRFDARRTPHMFVIDAKGILRYHGAIDDDAMGRKEKGTATNYVVNAVRQLVAGETVTPNAVKPYGCSVKYRH